MLPLTRTYDNEIVYYLHQCENHTVQVYHALPRVSPEVSSHNLMLMWDLSVQMLRHRMQWYYHRNVHQKSTMTMEISQPYGHLAKKNVIYSTLFRTLMMHSIQFESTKHEILIVGVFNEHSSYYLQKKEEGKIVY